MEKKAIDHLEHLYKDELNSHEFKKVINNIDIMSFKLNDLQKPKKLSSKNSRNLNDNIPKVRNSLIFKHKPEKDSININLYKPKEEVDNNLFEYSHSDTTKKEEIVSGNNKFKKRNNMPLKLCKTFKNCGDNINNAQFLLFNKNNNKQSINPITKVSSKNCLSSNKRGSLLTSKKRKKSKDKEKISPIKNDKNEKDNMYILKTKKTYHKTNFSNNKLLSFPKINMISDFHNENENENKQSINNNNKYYKRSSNNIFSQFRQRAKSNYIRNFLKIHSNNHRKKTINEKSNPNKNKNYAEIIYDTDNEFENNILCLLDKSFKNKRNSALNTKKHRHYGTMEIYDDKFLKNFNNSLDDKQNMSNDIGKMSNSNSISIIQKTELNHCNLNNEDKEFDDEFLQVNSGNINLKYKQIPTQKVVSLDSKEKDNEEDNDNNINNNQHINKSNKSKKKKKVIIYNNINYFRNTQREEDNDAGSKTNKNNNNEDKNDSIDTYGKKNSKRCVTSFFNCCFLAD